MTQEEKELLIFDICCRLPFGVNIRTNDGDEGYITGIGDLCDGEFEIHILEDGDSYSCFEKVENFKQYLRPMESMTSDEECEVSSLGKLTIFNHYTEDTPDTFHWYNSHHFDYFGLIDKGLALELDKGLVLEQSKTK